MIRRNLFEGGILVILSLLLSTAFLASCGGSHSRLSVGDGDEVVMRYADYLTISRHPGFTEVTVRNPWDSVRTLQRYILVPSDSVLPERLPEGILVRTPVSNALVYSSVHAGLISELGALDAIGGLCNAGYINDPELKNRLASERIADCGQGHNPDIEKIIRLRPQAILLSPYENNDKHSRLAELGIPVIECADYMETSPLGRAEWSRFYGLLFGAEEEAEKMFADTEREYLRLRELASKATSRPEVIFDQRYGQVWSVPGKNSTTGQLIEDAGGKNPFDVYEQSGSVQLDPEKVLGMAHDADIWFVRYNQKTEKSLEELAADAPVNSRFRAYRNGNVYGCNTGRVNLFEETPFHPDRLLRDMVILIHPELSHGEKPTYYYKLNDRN